MNISGTAGKIASSPNVRKAPATDITPENTPPELYVIDPADIAGLGILAVIAPEVEAKALILSEGRTGPS